jgi:hypothetical protein
MSCAFFTEFAAFANFLKKDWEEILWTWGRFLPVRALRNVTANRPGFKHRHPGERVFFAC